MRQRRAALLLVLHHIHMHACGRNSSGKSEWAPTMLRNRKSEASARLRVAYSAASGIVTIRIAFS